MRHPARKRWLSSLAVAALVACGLARDARAEVDDAAAATFDGRYVFAGGARQRAAYDQAIDRVVGQMNVMIRSLARSLMTRRIIIAREVRFTAHAGGVHIVHEPLPPRRVVFGGGPLRLTNSSGDSVSVSYRHAPNQLVETISTPRSFQRNTYRLSEGGRRLTLGVVVRAPQLPAPVRYSLSYRRIL